MTLANTLHEVKQQAATIVGRYNFQKSMIYSQHDHDLAKQIYKAVFQQRKFGKEGIKGGTFDSDAFGGMDACGNCRNKVYGQLHTFAHEK